MIDVCCSAVACARTVPIVHQQRASRCTGCKTTARARSSYCQGTTTVKQQQGSSLALVWGSFMIVCSPAAPALASALYVSLRYWPFEHLCYNCCTILNLHKGSPTQQRRICNGLFVLIQLLVIFKTGTFQITVRKRTCQTWPDLDTRANSGGLTTCTDTHEASCSLFVAVHRGDT